MCLLRLRSVRSTSAFSEQELQRYLRPCPPRDFAVFGAVESAGDEVAAFAPAGAAQGGVHALLVRRIAGVEGGGAVVEVQAMRATVGQVRGEPVDGAAAAGRPVRRQRGGAADTSGLRAMA